MPKAFCRSTISGVQFTDVEVVEETCQVTKRLADHRESDGVKARHPSTQQATQMSARFREGREPNLLAGLDLLAEDGGEDREPGDGEEQHLQAPHLAQ